MISKSGFDQYINEISYKLMIEYEQLIQLKYKYAKQKWETKIKQSEYLIILDFLHTSYTNILLLLNDDDYKYYTNINNFGNIENWFFEFQNVIYTNIEQIYNQPIIIQFKKSEIKKQLYTFHKRYTHKILQLQNYNKYGNREVYIDDYLIIAKAKFIRTLYIYIHKHYHKIFSYNNIVFLKMVLYKKCEYLTEFKHCIINNTDLSKKQRKHIRSTISCLNIKLPYLSLFIGNVLNHLFTRDIALAICDYI
jgi:hypothetical protein